ncbi:signal recognition particle-docking protein FtsY [Tepidiphilus baoligensis]|uniref:Signal recognition particle receptor FtsY n=1 Tax=Tepidiphilus baoligensis TaxID=2698687 RepID=A0ABX1QKV7_9PROT|nr:signal recognition particle-docking protein FtsY [Tepidiphilus baoligensis]NMH16031.1 signal recognition particle-docking protein FtsY [Tepidiphilus baoligensis]
MFGLFKRKKTEPAPAVTSPQETAEDGTSAEATLDVPADGLGHETAAMPTPGQVEGGANRALPQSEPSRTEAQTAALPDEAPTESAPRKRSWAERLKAGLARTRQNLSGLFGRRRIDEELLEEIETTLLLADCGVEATQWLMDALRRRIKKDGLTDAEQLRDVMAELLTELLLPLQQPLQVEAHQPFIIMVTGVNGAGKTTSIGKLAKYFQSQGKTVLLGAGDTFRAAAREQLVVWGERNGVPVIAQEHGDPAAVAFDAVQAAKARGVDVAIIDTAGRLPTQLHLMEEIAKVRRVIAKAEPGAPHEVLLVLDANIGQNAITQVEAFDKAVGLTGLVLTKLDGTAKGGVIAAIARRCPKPVRFIGVGEGIDDLRPFSAREFVEALLGIER